MYAAILKYLSGLALCCLFVAALTRTCSAQLLYSETFDDGMAVNRWTAFPGVGFDVTGNDPRPIDTNFDTMPFASVDGINDTFTGFSFDYSAVGIPPAPHSTGETTIGLKLQANLFSSALGGFSVSPNGLNLEGDYVVRFDHWANTLGPMPAGGSGSTNLSTFGILATGTKSESILSSTGVFFAYTADGESTADYRAYSVEDQNSYSGMSDEPHAIYHAGSRDTPSSVGGVPGAGNSLYNTAFGTGRTVPPSQIDIVGPAGTNEADQRGVINSGAAGFRWNDVEIRKIANSVTWTVNGSLLITVDRTDFSTPTLGGNISFGHADINALSSLDPAAEKLIFSLVDNIRVDPILAGDYNRNGVVDGADYTVWRDTLGQTGAAAADGDFNGIVDALDYDLWKANFGNALGSGSVEIATTNATVPEPAAMTMLIVGLIALYLRRPTTSYSRLD